MWHFGGHGRRTGVQLRARDQCDEWGMEPLESVPFSPDPANTRDHTDAGVMVNVREDTNATPSGEGVEIAQPLLPDFDTGNLDISAESLLLAWQAQSSRTLSTSVEPLPAAIGRDAVDEDEIHDPQRFEEEEDQLPDIDLEHTLGDACDCVEGSPPPCVTESPVLEDEMIAQSYPQSIHPDEHTADSQPCSQNDRNATALPRKRGRPRKVTKVFHISREQQTHASSNNAYESLRQNSERHMVPSSHPLRKSRGRPPRSSRQRTQKFSDQRTQRQAKTIVRSGETITRSGRRSFPPVSVWRGDRIVEGKEAISDSTGQGKIVVPTVVDIIRAPDNAAVRSKDKPKKRREGGGQNGTQKANNTQQEVWEMIAGRRSVKCRLQHIEEGDDASDDDDSDCYDLDVAFSSGNILGYDCPRNQVHWGQVKAPDFSPFGLMNMPPETEKPRSHAKTTSIIFFVHDGQVTITINEESFKVSTGSVFIVPQEAKVLRAWEVQALVLAVLEVEIPGY
ncbi:hypothetical protein ACKLNR_014490 [Fusarium oxysporum f. sp. zingiberi]